MTLKLTEAQISQIISEETKSLMEERQQLGEGLPAALGLGALYTAGRFAATRAAWPALQGLGRLLFGSGLKAVVLGLPTVGAAAQQAQAMYHIGSNPDAEKIFKLIPEDASEPLRDSMVAYSQEYGKFIAESFKFIFHPTDRYSRMKEIVPSLGLDRVFSGADYSPTLTIDYTPNNPSTEAVGRRQEFLAATNKIIMENTPITDEPLSAQSIVGPLSGLVETMLAREWQIARDRTREDRFPIKSEDEAEKFLLSLVGKIATAAATSNKIVRNGLAATQQQAAAQAEKEGAAPEEAQQQTQAAVARSVKPTYQLTNITQNAILNDRGVLKKFDRSLPSGAEGEGIVRAVQGMLQVVGIKIGKDGYFGPKTEKAVKEFQKSNRLEVNGQVGKKTLEELIERSVEKEIQDAEGDELLPFQAKNPGQQTEQGADNSLPFPVLVKKIERLQELLPKAKDSEKLKARIQRAKDRLQAKLAKRQQRSSKKMKITERQFMSVILEETKAILAEQPREALDMDRYISSLFNTISSLTPNITGGEMAHIFAQMKKEIRFGIKQNFVAGFEVFDTNTLDRLSDGERKQIGEVLTKSILTFMKMITVDNSELRQTFNNKINDIFSSGGLINIISLTTRMSQAMARGKYTFADGGIADQLGIQRPSPPALGTSSGQGKAQKLPRTTQGATGVDVSDLPNDWKAFASKSEAHKAMAKAWLAATGGGTISEAVALPDNSNFRSFVQWYNDSKTDGWSGIEGRGAERGPTAIASYLSSQAQPAAEEPAAEPVATEPVATEPEATEPVSSTASVVAMRAAGPAIGKVVEDLRGIEKALKAKKGPTKTVVYDFSKVDGFLPGGVADFGNVMFAKGPFGNRKRALLVVRMTTTLLVLLKTIIEQGEDATVEQNEEFKRTAEEIQAEVKKIRAGEYDEEPDALEESVKRRWQKLIKG